MAKKHQIWSKRKSTRVRAGRKWRRQFNEQLRTMQRGIAISQCSSIGRARKDVFPSVVVKNECPGEDYMPSKHEVASSSLATGSHTPLDFMRLLRGEVHF